MVPARAVEQRALEFVHAGDVGIGRNIQQSGGADHGIGVFDTGFAILATDGDIPQSCLPVPDRRNDLLIEPDMIGDTHLGIAFFDISLDFVATREIVIPVRFHAERIGIEMVGCIDCDAGIGVFVPGATDVVVLFYDDIVIARFLQFCAHGNAGKAGADYENTKCGQLIG